MIKSGQLLIPFQNFGDLLKTDAASFLELLVLFRIPADPFHAEKIPLCVPIVNTAFVSEDSATSKKLEMNLTNVARSSIGELVVGSVSSESERGRGLECAGVLAFKHRTEAGQTRSVCPTTNV
jgi:hypothetical protein